MTDNSASKKTYKQLVDFGLDKHGFYGLIYSSDNGANYKLLVGTQGRIFYPEDARNFWPYLKGFVSEQLASAISLDWNNIKNKPDVALKSDLPVVPTDLVHTAELEKVKSDVTQAKQYAAQAVANAESANVTIDTSLTNYAKKSDLPKLDDYAKKTDIPQAPDLTGYAKLSDIPSVTGLVKEAELADYAKLADVPKSMSWSQITGKPILALKSDIPNVSGFLKQADLDGYAKKSDIPKPPDLSGYAKLTDIPKPPDLTPYAKTSEVDEVKATADSALSKAEEAQSTADANSKALADKANKSEIPDISGLAKKSDIPVLPDLNSYALKSELPSLSGYARLSDIPSVVGLVKEAELADYAKKSDIPAPVDLSGYAKIDVVDAVKTVADKAQAIADTNSKLLETKVDRKDLPTVPTDLVHSAELDQVRTDISQAKQDAAQAVTVAKNTKTAIDTSDEFTVKKPSEYPEGFSHELKEVFELIPDRSNLDSTAQDGFQAIVTTEVCKGYARQTLKVIDSQRPLTFIRNGYGSTWYPFELVTTW